MERTQFIDTMWTCIELDPKLTITEITNHDDRLFFGRCPSTGETIPEAAGDANRQAVEIIMAGIRRSLDNKRHSCSVYFSEYAKGNGLHVSVHVEYHDDKSVCLYLTPLDISDLQMAHKNTESEVSALLHTIYEELPTGIEIYDKEGRMVEINAQGLKATGVTSKEAVLGIQLFDNPVMSDQVRRQLLAGENVHTIVEYDFNYLEGYIETVRQGVRHLDISVWIIRDSSGTIDKYIVVSEDITEHVLLKKKYESLYKQSMTILDSLPIGITVYSPEGAILYVNGATCRIFGTERETIVANPANMNDSPVIPESIKDAVRKGSSVRGHFPYDFGKAKKDGHFPFVKSDVRQLECTGCPIMNAEGKVESYVFILEDATEKIEREEMLRQNRRKTEIAMQAADIMFWEFDVAAKLFYSDNEPMNGYDRSKPMTIDQYLSTLDADNRGKMAEIMNRMIVGENFSFDMDAFVMLPYNPEWQYCSINGSPYESKDGRVVKYVGTRKNNTELYKRRQLQDKILNSLPISIHIKDVADDFRYIFCNDESKRLFGTGEDGTTYDVMEEEKVRLIRKTDLEVYNTGIPYSGQERVELKDGRVYETIVRKSIIEDNGRRLLLSTRWDQSLQNELQRRSQLFNLTLEAMNAFTWFYEPDKERINFGDGFDKIERKASEINTLERFLACIHPDDVRKFADSLQAILSQKGGIWKVESRLDLNGDGAYQWWETRGILETTIRNDVPHKYMYGMTICIEPYKKTELTLRRNKEELDHLVRQNELILNNTNSGLAYITTDFIVQWENISLCSASLSFEAYKKGVHCYKSAHKRNSPCENCVMQRALVSHQMERIGFTLDNNRNVEVFATPVFKEDESIDGIVIRVDDVTDRQRMIEELQQAKAMAEQSDKLKSAFLANMSHEIRTPLNAIVGFSELLLTAPEDEEREEYITIINNNNELLLKLINDILDLSKIEAGVVEFKYEEFDLAEYFNGMAASMTHRVTNSNVRLISINPYAGCRVNLDKNRVAQLMTNYVTNAIKYTPKGFIEMGYQCVGGGVRFYVKDTGIGISEEKKEKVFHRFAKLDEFAQGTGLGLSICKAIAESMGGNVGFESRNGEGSLFWAFLPCTPDIQASAETPGKLAMAPVTGEDAVDIGFEPVPGTGRKTILIVEDIQSNFLLLSALLRKQYTIKQAHNGQEAIETVRREEVDLVFMDMKMPVMDGLTATAEIRKFAPVLPIVALTAHAFESDRLAALAAGCDEYLVKPIDKSRLNTVLKKYCSGPFGTR